tara:strand:- start:1721 stop:1939 length:219 start_codon:yes stop_codon:yes gene_type:complete
MIKFVDGNIVFTRTIKNNKGKLQMKFTLPDDGSSFLNVKNTFWFWEDHIKRCCRNKNFPNNLVTEKYFMEDK